MKPEKPQKPFLSRKNRIVLLFNIPAYTVLLIFTVFPIAYCFYMSLLKYDLTRPSIRFMGLNNFQYLLTNNIFWISLGNTIVFTFSSLLLIFLTSLGFALLLNEPIKGTNKLKALIVTPWAIPPIVTGIIWAWIFDAKYGIVNYLLSFLGLMPFRWLSSPTLAMLAVVIARSWHEITFGTLMLLAGLQSIPVDVYEAAKVDGANTLDRFVHITLPLLRNHIAIVLIFETMWCLREFPIIYAMTYGGPGTATTVLGWLAYKFAFLYYDLGKGAAVAVILGILTIILAIAFIKFIYRRIEY